MTDHDISVAPSVIWDELRAFNEDYFEGKMELTQNAEKKHFLIEVPEDNLKVKVKFLELNEQESDESEQEDEPSRLRVRFTKKMGDLSAWYGIFNDMKDSVFQDILLAPR
jgi:hypothetical protein